VLIKILVDDQYSGRVTQARAKANHYAVAVENRQNGRDFVLGI